MSRSQDTSVPRRRRRWRRIAWIATTVAVVAGFALPWWLPAIVVRVASGRGVTVGSWTSHGWRGVEYRDLHFARDGVDVRIDVLRTPALLVFPRGGPAGPGAPRIAVGTVDLKIQRRAQDRPRASQPGVALIVGRVESLWDTLAAWLPATRVERVAITTEGESVAVESLIWDGASLQGSARAPGRGLEGVASIVRSSAGPFVVHARVPAREMTADLTVTGRG